MVFICNRGFQTALRCNLKGIRETNTAKKYDKYSIHLLSCYGNVQYP